MKQLGCPPDWRGGGRWWARGGWQETAKRRGRDSVGGHHRPEVGGPRDDSVIGRFPHCADTSLSLQPPCPEAAETPHDCTVRCISVSVSTTAAPRSLPIRTPWPVPAFHIRPWTQPADEGGGDKGHSPNILTTCLLPTTSILLYPIPALELRVCIFVELDRKPSLSSCSIPAAYPAALDATPNLRLLSTQWESQARGSPSGRLSPPPTTRRRTTLCLTTTLCLQRGIQAADIMERQQRDHGASQNWQRSPHLASSSVGPQRRNDGQPIPNPLEAQEPRLTCSESWVEISSQPSSSSLSSIGDEIVTTGLRVGSSVTARRRRLNPTPIPRSYLVDQATIQGTTSSQDEYDETESEEDRMLASSTENVQRPPHQPFQSTAAQMESDDSDDDENATALGRRTNDPVFRPHPNVFSHPHGLAQRSHSTTSAAPSHPHSRVRPSLSQRAQTRVSRGPPNFMSPSYRADNEEALRSSLTTLLSCAAAARGLPKYKDAEQQGAPPAPTGVGPSTQPVELRLMPEDQLMAETPPPALAAARPKSPSRARAVTPSTDTTTDGDKNKRPAAPQTRPSRAAKKKKVALDDSTTYISPTILSWVMGAGVVVLVSVVGFGAGYVIGREVGRQEAFAAAGSSAGVNASSLATDSSCGREVMRTSGGLRRLRWGASVVASA